jgi:CUG-BP- and ETR3-like factor
MITYKLFAQKNTHRHAKLGQPVNASLPSPTMPTFNMAAAQPNGPAAGAEAVYSNGIPHTYPGRTYQLRN